MNRLFFLIILFFSQLCLVARPPELTPGETSKKAAEILKAHVRYKTFDETVAAKAFVKFLEELDPSKTYLTKEEIEPWLTPSDKKLRVAIQEYTESSFTSFEEIYSLFQKSIERRNELEAKLKDTTISEQVDYHEFKKIDWADDPNALFQRIQKIRALQLDAASKVDDESKERFIKRIEKRRLSREQEFLGNSRTDDNKYVLSYFLKALAGALDTHTVYFTPTEADQFLSLVQQKLVGIGAQLRDDLNGFTLTRLLEGGPALRSGVLKVGDRIIAVNHEAVVGMDITEAVELIKGDKGSKVTLTLLRENETESGEKQEEKFTIDIIRDEIVLQDSRIESSVEHFGDGVILHIHLHSFYQDETSSSADDIRKIYQDTVKNTPVLGIILDLRNNAGGLLSQAVAVSGLFIEKGIVCSVKDHAGKVEHLRNLDDSLMWKGPLLVLTNVGSASASEIVAQSLQDWGRSLIIGDERTFGKGSYQTFTLGSLSSNKTNPKGEYKVTRGLYYTTSGKSPQFSGAKADVVVPGEFSKLEIGEQFAQFALPNESISPNFEDSLSDVHPFYRGKVKKMYGTKIQKPSNALTQYTATLQKNSQARVASNTNYQLLLSALEEENYDLDKVERYGQNDLQLEETFFIMKDLILLSQNEVAEKEKS